MPHASDKVPDSKPCIDQSISSLIDEQMWLSFVTFTLKMTQ